MLDLSAGHLMTLLIAIGAASVLAVAWYVKPELLIVDGGAGLEAALAAIWGDVPTQRCSLAGAVYQYPT
jgi:hypothetical protein